MGGWTRGRCSGEKKVFPKLSFLNHLTEVPVGGRNNPHIDLDHLMAPTRLNSRS
jgi:hypothetical protein